MSILADHEIRALRFIEPCCEMHYRPGVLSHGLSSFGYDARLGTGFRRPHGGRSGLTILDPKAPQHEHWTPFTEQAPYPLGPGEFILGHTVERFNMPDDVMAVCFGKSSYARNGLHVVVTPLEPGWSGQVTLELANVSRLPVMLYPGEGICQFVFLRGTRPEVTYAEKGGKYQGQEGATVSRP